MESLTVRWVIATLALALCLLGCSGEPVPLLTGSLGCYAGGEQGNTGRLVVDAKYGTSFMGRPVMWPGGYTARRAGSEVEVLDANGNVKATTGRTYHISYAHAPALIPQDDGSLRGPEPTNAYPAAVECGYAWDFIDCAAAPADGYCRTE